MKNAKATWMEHIPKHEGLLHTVLESAVKGNEISDRVEKGYIDQIVENVGCRNFTTESKHWLTIVHHRTPLQLKSIVRQTVNSRE